MDNSSSGCYACDCTRNERDMKDFMNQTLSRSYIKHLGYGNYNKTYGQWYHCFKYLSEHDQISYKLNRKKLTITANVNFNHVHDYYKWKCEKCDPTTKYFNPENCTFCNKQFCHKFKVPKSQWIEYKGLDINDYYKKDLPTCEPNKMVYGGFCIRSISKIYLCSI
jgi:hypothetical protein